MDSECGWEAFDIKLGVEEEGREDKISEPMVSNVNSLPIERFVELDTRVVFEVEYEY